MYKLLILFVFLGTTFQAKSQLPSENQSDIFLYTQFGLTPKYSVVEVDSVEKSELYNRVLNWIKETYTNPDKVIKAQIDNDKIRFEGYQDNLICVKVLGSESCYGATYSIEIEVKDNKYRFVPLSLEYRVPSSQYARATDNPVDFNDGGNWFNKKGEVRSLNKTSPTAVENLFNGLNKSLSKYVSASDVDKEDW